MTEINPDSLALAIKRRQMKQKDLASFAGISAVQLSNILKGKSATTDATVRALSKALRYPVNFLCETDIEVVKSDIVSFQSMASIRASEKNAAIAAGSIGLRISDWIDDHFNLPASDVPNCSDMEPEEAAAVVRQYWNLGERPVKQIIRQLEARGVRLFSLSEETRNVDAFSFWRSERPFVFLNLFKTAESTVFDCAHELGHLVLHRHADLKDRKRVESEANRFASSFLMPERDCRARLPGHINAQAIIHAKSRWHVSAMALVRRCYDLERMTEWGYRSACIELTKMGYRTGEPSGIEREPSVVWPKVFTELWRRKETKDDVAKELMLPLDELESLVFGNMKRDRASVRSEQLHIKIRVADKETSTSPVFSPAPEIA